MLYNKLNKDAKTNLTPAEKMLYDLGFILKYENEKYLCFISEKDEVIQFIKEKNYGVSVFQVNKDNSINHAKGLYPKEIKAIYAIMQERNVI